MIVTFKLNSWKDIAIAETCNDIAVANLKGNQKLFRYETPTTLIGGMRPLILIDVEKKLAYFLKNAESESIEFDSRGERMIIFSVER
jgi:hypothetical protein